MSVGVTPWLDNSLITLNKNVMCPGQRCGGDCDDANMQYVELWLAVEKVKIVLRLATKLIFI